MSNEIRYVGQTKTTLPNRLYRHLFKPEQSGRTDHRTQWLSKQVRVGTPPRIELVQEVPIEHLSDAEIYWIAYYRSLGCQLTNHHPGGNGGWEHMKGRPGARKGVTLSTQTREQISQKLRGRKLPASTRKKMSDARQRDRDAIASKNIAAWNEGRAGNQWTTGKASNHPVSCISCRKVCKGASALKGHATKVHVGEK